jgi:hypothetical protein
MEGLAARTDGECGSEHDPSERIHVQNEVLLTARQGVQ